MKSDNGKSCRVLLLNPPISSEIRYGKFKDVGSYLPPYGLLSIAAVLEKGGHVVRVADADNRRGLSFNGISKIIADFQPHIIGMTAYSIGREQVIKTAECIRAISSALLVVGGPHAITIPEDLQQFGCFDIVAFGEGESTMVDIMQYLQGERKLVDIDGIIYRDNGRIVKTAPRSFVHDLDTLPYPAYHLLEDLDGYRPMQLLYKRLPLLPFITGRGCPFNCVFCNSIWGKKVRLNSASYIMGGVRRMVHDFGIREIMFYEDTFCINKKRISDLCDMILDEEIRFSWTCSANARTLDKHLLKKMKAAGCWLISIGIESGNDQVLKFIRKPIRRKEAERVCEWADEVGLQVRGFFMIGHPIDTKATIRQTIDFAKSLPLFTVNFTILQLLPGSEVRKFGHMYGEVNYDYQLGTGHPGETLSFVAKGLTAGYLKEMQKRAYTEFFLRPKQIWRMLKFVDSMDDVKKYFELIKPFLRLYF